MTSLELYIICMRHASHDVRTDQAYYWDNGMEGHLEAQGLQMIPEGL